MINQAIRVAYRERTEFWIHKNADRPEERFFQILVGEKMLHRRQSEEHSTKLVIKLCRTLIDEVPEIRGGKSKKVSTTAVRICQSKAVSKSCRHGKYCSGWACYDYVIWSDRGGLSACFPIGAVQCGYILTLRCWRRAALQFLNPPWPHANVTSRRKLALHAEPFTCQATWVSSIVDCSVMCFEKARPSPDHPIRTCWHVWMSYLPRDALGNSNRLSLAVVITAHS